MYIWQTKRKLCDTLDVKMQGRERGTIEVDQKDLRNEVIIDVCHRMLKFLSMR